MPKVRTTVTLDDELLRSIKVVAAREGKRDSEVIEEAVRRYLGFELLEHIWARNTDLGEDQAMELALDAQQWAREQLKRERPQPA